MPSNGTLITDAVAKKLRQSGIDTVNISIEGTKDFTTRLGCRAFEKAVAAIEHLTEQKISVTIATTVTSQNYKSLPYVIGLQKPWSQHGDVPAVQQELPKPGRKKATGCRTLKGWRSH